MSLTITDVCERLGIGRSTAKRWLATGRLEGEKRHACGVVCSEPATCQHGTWHIPEKSLKSARRKAS